MIRYFEVAGFRFAIEATPEQLEQVPNYTPFITDESDGNSLFIIRVQQATLLAMKGWEHVFTDSSEGDLPRIELYKNDRGEWLFSVAYTSDGPQVSMIRCSADWREVTLYTHPNYVRFAIDNAAMLVYAFATNARQTLLFHSSVIRRQGQAFMFLGKSGTGKSTHSEQWLKAFPDAELLNDDNPVVRLLPDGSVRVYGSPWSGKTPCYRAVDAPVKALVQLAQAPQNQIVQLKMTQAYPYMLASVSGLKLQPDMMDHLYESIAALLERVPVYKLDCLPNEQAARLCAQTCLS